MKAYDFNAVVYNECQIACTRHFPLVTTVDGINQLITIDSPCVYPIFACDEMDHYPVCDICGDEHDYVNLTDDGRKYYNLKDGE